MVKAWQIPFIISAVNFLFDIGRVLIKDVLNKRQQRESNPDLLSEDELEGILKTKEDVFEVTVNEAIVEQRRTEVEHLLRLAEIYRQNYRLAEEKYARWGDALVPSVVMHELRESEQHLIETLIALKLVMGNILGKAIDLS